LYLRIVIVFTHSLCNIGVKFEKKAIFFDDRTSLSRSSSVRELGSFDKYFITTSKGMYQDILLKKIPQSAEKLQI
jgi:hypothetical protein